MPLAIDWLGPLIKVTSSTTDVDVQTLHDFIEDQMASPEGLLYGDIIQPEGKIEDPVNPGVFSQIIVVLNSPWQIQFWGGSGYTRVYGGKVVGGLNDQPIKATGTAGDVTVLESPVDGLTVVSGSGVTGQDKQDIANLVESQTGAPLKTSVELVDTQIQLDAEKIERIDETVEDNFEELSAMATQLGEVQDQVQFIDDIDAGRWKIDKVNCQMIFYKPDNITEIARFALLDEDGNPSHENVFERVRV